MKTSRNKGISSLLGNMIIAGFLLFFSFVSVVNAETFNITSTAGANGTISPAGLTPLAEGDSQIYDITPDAGYDLDTLTVDGNPVPPTTTIPSITYQFDNNSPVNLGVFEDHTVDVTFHDITPPVFPTPIADQTFEATGPLTTPTLVLPTPVATDTADPALVVTSDTTDFQLGTTLVTWTATDASGNTATATSNVTITDTTAPTLTLIGPSAIYVLTGSTYVDPGLESFDLVDQILNNSVVEVSNDVDTPQTGVYSIVFQVTDSSLNSSATVTRTVNVVDALPIDTTAPVITMLGANPTSVIVGTTYTDAGAEALDDIDQILTSSIVTDLTQVSTSAIGTFTITYTVTDSSLNTTTVTRTVNVIPVPPVDTTAPVITITGANPISVLVGTTYNDPGATALDNVDLVITVTSDLPSSVDTAVIATYTVTYTATDSSGNTSTATRTVDVVPTLPADITAPVITLTGGASITVAHGSTFVEPGFTATDNIDGLLPNASIAVTSNVDMMVVGTYTITYTATDSSGNIANLDRTVNVTDQTAPIITAPVITPTSSDQTFEATGISTTPVLVQATAIDAVDLNNSIITVDTTSFALGTTTVTWTATDAAGNSSSITSLVTIVDTTAPTLTAPADQTFEATGTITTPTLAQATATDLVDPTPAVTVDITSFGLGNTTITWTATDANGNSSTTTSVVTIEDTTAPTITVSGTNPLTISAGTTYTDAGATATDIVDGTTTVTTSGTVNTNALNTYTLTYTSTDTSGNTATATRAVTVIDTTAPVITLTGANPFNVASSVTATYTDPGATAIDNINGTVTVTNNSATAVNMTALGTYVVTYTATDASGNIATTTRNVLVTNTLIPVITMNGANPINISVGATYNDPGASAFDDVNGIRPVITVSTVNTMSAGAYTVTYTASDLSGNTATAVRNVNVVDTTYPTITILGVSALSVALNGVYVDAGATAVDNIDGTLPVTTVSTVNTSAVGTYTVTYTATDSSGNTTTAVRTVTVTTSPAPIITMNGVNPTTASAGLPYTDAGATAFDIDDGVISVTTTGSVNTGVIGTYTITYTAVDTTGNVVTATRTVNVVDNIAPVVTINGNQMINILVGGTYTESGATAVDAFTGSLAVTTVSTVNTAVIGNYTVTYTATDASGNIGTAVRNVLITNTFIPVITITGGSNTDVNVGSVYTDAGATALDDVDGTIPTVTVSSSVNTSTLGSYIVIYNATDSSGNVATATRTVNVVVPPTPPASSGGGGGGAGGAGMFIGSNSAYTPIPTNIYYPPFSSTTWETPVYTNIVTQIPEYFVPVGIEYETNNNSTPEVFTLISPPTEEVFVTTINDLPIDMNTKKENVFAKIYNNLFGDNQNTESEIKDVDTDLKAEVESSDTPISKKVIIIAIILLAVGGIMEFNLYRTKKVVEPVKPFPIKKEIDTTEPPIHPSHEVSEDMDEIKDLFDEDKK